jgi:hypothetical protein
LTNLLRRTKKARREGLPPASSREYRSYAFPPKYKSYEELFQDAVARLPQWIADAVVPSGANLSHHNRIETALSSIMAPFWARDIHVTVTHADDTASARHFITTVEHRSLAPIRAEGDVSEVMVEIGTATDQRRRPKEGMGLRCGIVVSIPILHMNVEVKAKAPGMFRPLAIPVESVPYSEPEARNQIIMIGEKQVKGRDLQPEDLEAIAVTLEQAAADIAGK